MAFTGRLNWSKKLSLLQKEQQFPKKTIIYQNYLNDAFVLKDLKNDSNDLKIDFMSGEK